MQILNNVYGILKEHQKFKKKKRNNVVIKFEKIKDLYIYYNNISNFPFINHEYIYNIYSKQKKVSANNIIMINFQNLQNILNKKPI